MSLKTNFDNTPTLYRAAHFSDVPIPAPFLDYRYTHLVEILNDNLPTTALAMVGFWPTFDNHLLDPDSVVRMGENRQNLDIDVFLPICRTDQEYWQRLQFQRDNGSPDRTNTTISMGGNNSIVFCGTFTFLSPDLSQLTDDQLKPIITNSFAAHFPPEHVFCKTGRTGDPLVVIGENVSKWGANRRYQDGDNSLPYLEVMSLFIDIPGGEYLEDALRDIGYSPDLSPVYCRAYQGQYSPLDLHVSDPQIKSFGLEGLPPLNEAYIQHSPQNALNWIRREVKALALYSQLQNNFGNLPKWIIQQYARLQNDVEVISKLRIDIFNHQEFIDKINQSFSVIAKNTNHRFNLNFPEQIIPLADPQHSQSN